MFALIRSRYRRSDAAFSIQTQYILTMSTKASKPSGGRGKNWADDNCTTLAQNWICVSEDPQRGKDQPREEFWCRVAAKNEGRSADSCMKQFGRMAQAVQKFAAFVYQIGEKNVSGTTWWGYSRRCETDVSRRLLGSVQIFRCLEALERMPLISRVCGFGSFFGTFC